jgi:hypothetical protein
VMLQAFALRLPAAWAAIWFFNEYVKSLLK